MRSDLKDTLCVENLPLMLGLINKGEGGHEEGVGSSRWGKRGGGMGASSGSRQGSMGSDLKEVALVNKLALALLQLGPQPPELTLILAQQGALIHILIHPGCIADVLGPIGKLQGAQRLCNAHQD